MVLTWLFLKFQFRSGLFLFPIYLVIFYFAGNYYNVDLILFAFCVSCDLFANSYNTSRVSIRLLAISNTVLSQYILKYNLSLVFWFNLWYLFGVLIEVVFSHNKLVLPAFLKFNSMLLASLIIGNNISNSAIFTLPRLPARLLVVILFCVSIGLYSSLLHMSNYYWPDLYLIVLVGTGVVWVLDCHRYKKPKIY